MLLIYVFVVLNFVIVVVVVIEDVVSGILYLKNVIVDTVLLNAVYLAYKC